MNEQEDMAAFVEARMFATLVVSGPEGPVAAHIPMILNRDASGKAVTLEGHVTRINPLTVLAQSPSSAIAIFHGPDAYVTPSLYHYEREHGKVVPTWNYTAVHVVGAVEAFSDHETLHAQVSRLTNRMESAAAVPWKVSDAPADYVAKQLNGIVGMRLSIERLEGIRKLSQNRNEADRAGVLNGFTHSNDSAAKALAAEMKKA